MNSTEEEWEVTGKSIGYRMKDLDIKQQAIAQKLISDILFYAKIGKLSEDSSISISPRPIYSTSVSPYSISSFSPASQHLFSSPMPSPSPEAQQTFSMPSPSPVQQQKFYNPVPFPSESQQAFSSPIIPSPQQQYHQFTPTSSQLYTTHPVLSTPVDIISSSSTNTAPHTELENSYFQSI